MQQNVLEIKVQYTTIPVGLICWDPFSGAYEIIHDIYLFFFSFGAAGHGLLIHEVF